MIASSARPQASGMGIHIGKAKNKGLRWWHVGYSWPGRTHNRFDTGAVREPLNAARGVWSTLELHGARRCLRTWDSTWFGLAAGHLVTIHPTHIDIRKQVE